MPQNHQKMKPLERGKNNILRFASLGTQFLASIVLTAWLGVYIDKKLAFTTPIFVWLLPLLTIIGLLAKIIKDASQK